MALDKTESFDDGFGGKEVEVSYDDRKQVELIVERWKRRVYLGSTYEHEAKADILFIAGLILGEEAVDIGHPPAHA